MKYLILSFILVSGLALAEDKKEKTDETQERVKLETIIVKPVIRQPASTGGGRNLR